MTLKGEVDATKATVNDIASNPKNLKIKTIDAAQLARSLDTVDVALVPGNYSWAADLKPADALAMEKQDGGVIEVFVVRTRTSIPTSARPSRNCSSVRNSRTPSPRASSRISASRPLGDRCSAAIGNMQRPV